MSICEEIAIESFCSLHQVDSFFEWILNCLLICRQYNPYFEEVVPSVEESSASTETKPTPTIQDIRVVSISSLGASEQVRPSLQNRNPLLDVFMMD